MTKEELRKEFETETGMKVQGAGVYAKWLESRLANEGKYSEVESMRAMSDSLDECMSFVRSIPFDTGFSTGWNRAIKYIASLTAAPSK